MLSLESSISNSVHYKNNLAPCPLPLGCFRSYFLLSRLLSIRHVYEHWFLYEERYGIFVFFKHHGKAFFSSSLFWISFVMALVRLDSE